jgi:hypothetical protein
MAGKTRVIRKLQTGYGDQKGFDRRGSQRAIYTLEPVSGRALSIAGNLEEIWLKLWQTYKPPWCLYTRDAIRSLRQRVESEFESGDE